jgi:hypothetical protein
MSTAFACAMRSKARATAAGPMVRMSPGVRQSDVMEAEMPSHQLLQTRRADRHELMSRALPTACGKKAEKEGWLGGNAGQTARAIHPCRPHCNFEAVSSAASCCQHMPAAELAYLTSAKHCQDRCVTAN